MGETAACFRAAIAHSNADSFASVTGPNDRWLWRRPKTLRAVVVGGNGSNGVTVPDGHACSS